VTLVLAAALAFLVGSIPFGLVLTKAAGLGDIRKIGSGNIGATNVLRTGKKGLAIATLLLDGGKGAVAVLVAERFGTEAAVVAGAASVLGHMFTPWLAFKGGKGVATAGGVLLALAWPVGLLGIATWLAVAFATRYSSLAALVAAAAVPVYAWLLTERLRALLILFLAVIVLARHHENIRRLLRGEESKIKLSSGAG
jgi:glycerol-3-phosphate acyltransferase PlsY